MMNNQNRFQGSRSLPKPPVSCSVCGRPNILTRNCPCRRHVLSNLPTKNTCEPLRIYDNRLVFDITITTDIFIVHVNPFQGISKINGTMLQYLSILKRFPKPDNTIDLEFKFQNLRRCLTCAIDFGMEVPISIGLSDLLNLGMQFLLSDSVVNRNNIVASNPSHPQHTPKSDLLPFQLSHQPNVGNACSSQINAYKGRQRRNINQKTNRRNPYRPMKNKREVNKKLKPKDKILVTFANKDYNEKDPQNSSNRTKPRLSSTISKVQKKSNGDVLDVNVDDEEIKSIQES